MKNLSTLLMLLILIAIAIGTAAAQQIDIPACYYTNRNDNVTCNPDGDIWQAGVMRGNADARHFAEWGFRIKRGGWYEFWAEYATDTEGRPTDIMFRSGIKIAGAMGRVTGGWQQWELLKTIELQPGRDTFTIDKLGPIPHIRSFSLRPTNQ